MLPDLGTTQSEAAVIVGFFLPLVLAIPIQSHWPDSVRTLFAVAAYAAAGALTAAAGGSLTGKSFWEATLTILTLGVVGYQGIWKPIGAAPAIEHATNVLPTKPAEPAPATPEPEPSGATPPAGQGEAGAAEIASHLAGELAPLLAALISPAPATTVTPGEEIVTHPSAAAAVASLRRRPTIVLDANGAVRLTR